jgi:lipid-binding SYLF domain-containing protein
MNVRVCTFHRAAIAIIVGFAPSFAQCALADNKDKQRAEVRKAVQQSLDRLYQVQPAARASVANAAGYAVFSNFGMKILVAGGGKGGGIAVNNKTKQETFMKMAEVQAGVGMGVKKFRQVWVFESQKAFDDFVQAGWQAGAQTTAAAQAQGQGAALQGAVSVQPGVWLYQLTDEGLALEATAKGTKYYKDDELN